MRTLFIFKSMQFTNNQALSFMLLKFEPGFDEL